MARKKHPSVGVIGLGIIGSRVAARLRTAGFDVWVWNRSPRQEPNFLGSAREVAETVDTLLLFVPDGPALISTIESIGDALTPRHLVINHATVAPGEVRQAAELTTVAGAGFLDAPFTGSRLAAEAGQIVYYVGGPAPLLERARPILAASAKEILPLGEVGQASLIKIATNLVSAATVQALAESLALVDRAGIPLESFHKAIELNAVNSATAGIKLPAMLTGDFEPHFALKHMLKDVNLGLAEAQAAGVNLPAATAVSQSLTDGSEIGWGDLDFSAIAKHFGYPGKAAASGFPGDTAPAASDAPAPKKRPIFPLFGRKD